MSWWKFRARYGTFEKAKEAPSPGSLDESIASLEAQLLKLRHERDRCASQESVAHEFKWEQKARPWMLFALALGRVGRSVAGLVLLYWSIGIKRESLMECDARVLPFASLFACEYTKAFVRAFTMFALNIALAVAMRMILQERIYYGLLRAGGLLDFANAAPLQDPLLWLLATSLLHGVLHFGLKYWHSDAFVSATLQDDMEEASTVARVFLAPALIFMMLFYSSSDIESSLIPLNKYFEEDWQYAKRTLGSIEPMDERAVRRELEGRDVVGEAREPTIGAVYGKIIQEYPGFAGQPETRHKFYAEMWPAQVLLDPRLQDASSRSFRFMFMVFLAICVPVHLVSIVVMAGQAWKDIYVDVWTNKQLEDSLSFLVVASHCVFIAWLLRLGVQRTQMLRMSTCCTGRTKGA
eukprot:CAMPEP_0168431960 /NCGR_PEP_ID=MMETSP0228-20121227/38650_1 /TAXON_ID=133427 /ORGANISM="Protoceratium reticulatum, Strain CCCM 535 (=CCMP 1889)" /LENGTH=408 /DNA_ID=CAMNT_0008446083 /DNA_START=31 /DNA_END=1254 /DNA_ORIENTATION=+